MSKIYAPFGYIINNGKGYYDTENQQELLDGALALADWPKNVIEELHDSSTDELVKLFTDNGFEIKE